MAKARITIVGCGFVGISLGQAVKRALNEVEVVGHDKDRDAMRNAEMAGAIDRGDWNLPSACDGAAAVFVAIPQDGLEVTFKAIAREVQQNAIVVAMGGSNVAALKIAQEHLPSDMGAFACTLIYHPDRVGIGLRTPETDSLRDAMWTIAPRPGTNPNVVDSFVTLINELGSKPIFVDPVERDGMAIAVDALPLLLASTMMVAVSDDAAWRERQWMAGAAFGEAVAGTGSAARLAPLLLAQPEAAIHWLNQVMLQCMALRDAIRDRDAAAVEALLTRANERREQWLADWRKGRDDGRLPVERQSAVLSLFVGERMAGRLAGGKKH
jgi:prephenate dehydrogenase